MLRIFATYLAIILISVLSVSLCAGYMHSTAGGQSIYWKAAGAALAVGTAAGVISFFLIRRMTRPLENLEKAIRELTHGDTSARVPVGHIHELRHLVKTFNRMAERLDERIGNIISQRNELEAVLSGMKEGVLVLDADLKIVSINRACSEMFKAEGELATGQPLDSVIWNTDLQEIIAKLREGAGDVEQQVIVHAGANRQFLQAHGSMLTNASGSGIVIVFNEVTRLKLLEEIRTDFAANVSHELRTPITSIKGFVETLLEGHAKEPEDVKRFLEIIAKQANRLNAIIEDLLSLARIEQEVENQQIAMAEGNVKDVINIAITACASKAAAKNITLNVESENITMQMNAALLEQAVMNLVDNAIKYSDAGRTVDIKVGREREHVSIKVIDQGYGIAQEHLPRIFERFYVADKARSRRLGGTGLGLAIVKHIAAAHGGKVTVESTPGKGSTFEITLRG